MNVKTQVTRQTAILPAALLLVLSCVTCASAAANVTVKPPFHDPQSAAVVSGKDVSEKGVSGKRASENAPDKVQAGKPPSGKAAQPRHGRLQAAALPAAANPLQRLPAAAPLAATNHRYTSLILRANHLLSQDIDAWARQQGLHPLWNSRRDYLIFSTIYLHGKSRDEVLDQLGQLFRSENYGLVIRLYEKNNVLVIDSQ